MSCIEINEKKLIQWLKQSLVQILIQAIGKLTESNTRYTIRILGANLNPFFLLISISIGGFREEMVDREEEAEVREGGR
jgi:hypothetical protein